MSAQPVGAPDWQRGVVSAGKLLGKFAGPQTFVTVAIPPNAENIVVIGDLLADGLPIQASGVTSTASYPVIEVNTSTPTYTSLLWIIPVSSAIDSQLTIEFQSFTSGNYYVASDVGGDLFTAGLLSQIAQYNGNGINTYGVLAFGDSLGYGKPIALDVAGRVIPMVPTSWQGPTALALTNTQLIAAPASGSLYLFGVDFRNDAAAAEVGQIGDAAGNAIANVKIPAGSTLSVDLGGLRVGLTTALYALASSTSVYATLRYAAGP